MDFDPVAYINNPAWHSSIYGLERIEELLRRLGNPHKQLKFVHVAGTNGKSSTVRTIAATVPVRATSVPSAALTSAPVAARASASRSSAGSIPAVDGCTASVDWPNARSSR